MRYTMLRLQPREADKKINELASQGWKVVSQSESTWVIAKCFGLSKSVDAIINVIMVKEN